MRYTYKIFNFFLQNVKGVVLHIPMPGHVVGQSMMEKTEAAANQLQELVQNHDVVFLLLDSREARWLPTLLCAAMNKIAINAALGYDSYTVQRHGTRDISVPSPSNILLTPNPAGPDLGCYFCNDVTQPGNVRACLLCIRLVNMKMLQIYDVLFVY